LQAGLADQATGLVRLHRSSPLQAAIAIDLKTAKVLGLTVPQSVLARADEVIQ
jgi:hypothetical protein